MNTDGHDLCTQRASVFMDSGLPACAGPRNDGYGIRMTLSVDQVNAFDPAAFLARFADVAEHSPWVAEEAERARPYASRAAMTDAFAAAVEAAGEIRQMALLNAHPDLAGRAALAGDVAEASRREQAGAGLDRLTPEELARFTALNTRYRERFGFPFILAVRGAGKAEILSAYEVRIGRPRAAEMALALAQVVRIVQLRIEDRVAE